MNSRQKKKHLKKSLEYAIWSFELAERYLTRYPQANKFKFKVKVNE